MAKTKISEFSSTPANNTDIDSINIAEGCAPSNINDAIRELMAQLKDFQTGAVGDSFNGPMNGTIGATTAYSGAFTTLSASGTTTLSGLTASTALALDASKNVVSVANTGSGSNVLATSPTLVTPALGTPSSATLTNATGLPISTGVSGLGTGVATALAVNVGSAGAPVVNGGALGTPSSGTVTNLTGTASININGTVGATTPTTGAFTTVAASSSVTLSGGTANGVTYLNGSKVLTSGSALTFDGTNLGVGLSNPSAYGKFVVNGSANVIGGNYLYMWDSGNTNAPGMYAPGDSIAWKNSAGSTEWMRINGTGLGIGTSSPDSKLTVATTSGSTYVNVKRASQSAGEVGISLYGGTSGVNWSIYQPASSNNLQFYRGSDLMVLDSSGNLGLGVTPSAFGAGYKGFEIGAVGNALTSLSTVVNLSTNAIRGSSWTYGVTGRAVLYQQDTGAGTHAWYNAASGNAGNAITFTQAATLTADGNYLLGTTSLLGTSNGGRLCVKAVNSANTSWSTYQVDSNGADLFTVRADGLITTATTGSLGPYNYTTATAANMVVNSSGQFQRSTSSLKYKTDIQDATHGLAKVLALRPVTYKGKNDGDTIFGGLIAEEVHAAGLTEFVQYAEDGTPDALAYGQMVSLAFKAIQELKAEFDSYKASHP